jgi:hypothetical protein
MSSHCSNPLAPGGLAGRDTIRPVATPADAFDRLPNWSCIVTSILEDPELVSRVVSGRQRRGLYP